MVGCACARWWLCAMGVVGSIVPRAFNTIGEALTQANSMRVFVAVVRALCVWHSSSKMRSRHVERSTAQKLFAASSCGVHVCLHHNLPSPFPLPCAVAQGCPLSPFFHALSLDGLLEAVEMLTARPTSQPRPPCEHMLMMWWVPGIGTGFQRGIEAIKLYGDTWGCKADL